MHPILLLLAFLVSSAIANPLPATLANSIATPIHDCYPSTFPRATPKYQDCRNLFEQLYITGGKGPGFQLQKSFGQRLSGRQVDVLVPETWYSSTCRLQLRMASDYQDDVDWTSFQFLWDVVQVLTDNCVKGSWQKGGYLAVGGGGGKPPKMIASLHGYVVAAAFNETASNLAQASQDVSSVFSDETA